MTRPVILKIDPNNIDPKLIKQAAECIKNKGLVAFPTETVYGLGANALDAEAVAKIFEAKNRPLDDPLIVHIGDLAELYDLTDEVPKEAKKLVEHFWPGPLTVVVKKKGKVPDIVTTGLVTLAVRMPRNSVALEFISESGVPIAAPSANLFGKPSPTNAQHVIDDLDGRIDMILDGGKTEIGIESTVVEVVDGECVILRPGGIDIETIEAVIGEKVSFGSRGYSEKSPGKYPRHYSPNAAVLISEEAPDQVKRTLEIAQRKLAEGHNVGIMTFGEHACHYKEFNSKVLGLKSDSRMCAANLFHLLREFDSDKVDLIVAEGMSEKGLGHAVMNRLRKAAGV